MAYKIQYSPEAGYRYPQPSDKRQIKWGRWITLVLFFAAVLWLRVNGVPDFLIPGDPDVTKNATDVMIDSLRDGTAIEDAVTAFCKEILNGASF